MIVLGVDTETTGLCVANDSVIEVGAVLWEVSDKKPLVIYNELLTRTYSAEHDPQISEEAQEIHGVSNKDVAEFGKPSALVFETLSEMADQADYIVAHNAEFDYNMLCSDFRKEEVPFINLDRKWIDTVTDLPLPKHMKVRNLTTLAALHGFVNPFPHRAVTDVLTMLKVFSHYPIDEIIKRYESKTVRVVADVGFQNKDKAKSAGFYWNPEEKIWFRNIKEIDLEPEQQKWDFSYQADLGVL